MASFRLSSPLSQHQYGRHSSATPLTLIHYLTVIRFNYIVARFAGFAAGER